MTSFSVDLPKKFDMVCSSTSIMDVSALFDLQHKLKRIHLFFCGGGNTEIGLRIRPGDLDQFLDVFDDRV